MSLALIHPSHRHPFPSVGCLPFVHPGEGYYEVSQPHLDRASAMSKPGKGAASFMGPSSRRSPKRETAATAGSSATAGLHYRTDDWLALRLAPRPKPM
jgi:hypothetical protein